MALLMLVSIASALSSSEKTVIESISVSTLQKQDCIMYSNAEVGWDNNLKLWVIPTGSDQTTLLQMMGAVMGVYTAIYNNYPNIGDLTVYTGKKGSEAGEMTCYKSWISTKDHWNFDESDTADLMTIAMKMLGTFKQY
ncbi:Uncharacterised protein [uncultured archaeon]|nr:Uncharacterised protein [uncultured archaeon]